MLDHPIAPRKKRIILFGLLAGLLGGIGASLLVERRTGLVYSIEELQGYLPCPMLKQLPVLSPTAWHNAADLLASGPLATNRGGPTALIPVGDVPADQLQSFAEEMQRALNSRELIVSRDLRKTSTCANQLLLLAPGVVTRTQLSQLKQELALQDGPIAGWVFLDPVLKLS